VGTLADKLMMVPVGAGEPIVVPESVDLDGENDYLSRSSDLVGNADGKTFTFSCWLYHTNESIYIYNTTPDNSTTYLSISTNDYYSDFSINAYNAAHTRILYITGNNTATIPKYTWTSLVLSVDLADSGKRHLYINDVIPTDLTWHTYTNDTSIFAQTYHYVGAIRGIVPASSRLAHVFLDYNYRDLSIEANRRLFITDDGKPADGQANLSPILYMPMKDPDTWHINEGTGGDFTANGTVATSGRGPNQDNCVASTFDGNNDNLQKYDGFSAFSAFTFSFIVKSIGASQSNIFGGDQASGTDFDIFQDVGHLRVVGDNAASAVVFQADNIPTPVGATSHVVITADLNVADSTVILVNNVEVGYDLDDFEVGETIDEVTDYRIGRDGVADVRYFEGTIGEFYFDTTYTDLATDNPFWDSDTNRPKPIAQVIEETSATPLIALPINGSDAGKNLGTGGDFTVNSGPFTGARGASEYWARSAKKVSSGGLVSSSFVSPIATKTFSMFMAFKNGTLGSFEQVIKFTTTSGSISDKNRGEISTTSADKIFINILDGATEIIRAESGAHLTTNEWATVFISIDLTNTSNRAIVINGDSSGASFYDYLNQNMLFNSSYMSYPSDTAPNDTGVMYFTTDYIDFLDESERLKFVDGLGYPVDIQPAIEAGDIPEPLIYMPFDDPDDLGKNNGTGGDFTINGTVISGADVDPNA